MSTATRDRIAAQAEAALPANRSWPKRYLNREEAANYCGLGLSTLNNFACAGEGPLYIKISGRVLYAIEDLDSWLLSLKVDPATRRKQEPAPDPAKKGRGRPRKDAMPVTAPMGRKSTGGIK